MKDCPDFCLTRCIGQQVARQGVDEFGRRQQSSDFCVEVLAKQGLLCLCFFDKWLAQKSRHPRPLNASIFVARKYGAVTTLISKSRTNWCVVAASIAARYQRRRPAPSSVTSKIVTAPPTNTRSLRIGRSSTVVATSCSRFEFGIDLSEPPAQLSLGNLTLSNTSLT